MPLQTMRVHQQRLENRLRRLLSPAGHPAPYLAKAMQYAVLNGGKRFRPMLAWSAAEAFGAQAASADVPACAVELIHNYSLIHDDLPAMDDDKLRRGKPTCHIQFDEATAILAADALQTLAFELLTESQGLAVSDKTRLSMIKLLAQAAGGRGMVAGQCQDMQSSIPTVESLEKMHQLKTGALIKVSVLLGAMCNSKLTSDEFSGLEQFSNALGLAFQVKDDILDVISDTATLGKQQGRDIALQKTTYVSELGLEGAETKCRDLLDEALSILKTMQLATPMLENLTLYVGRRSF